MNWFDQFGWNQGEYGQAEVLATAKGTTVEGMKTAGVMESGYGKVRLLSWQEYPRDWNPEQDNKTPIWEALHQLIRSLQQQGEQAAGALLAGMPARSERVGKVHLNGKHFRCRHCYNLAYQSQRENAACRQLNRLKTIGKRLGGSIDIFGSMPVKPKGMHRNTYMRLLGQSHIMLWNVSQAISKHYKSQVDG